MQLSELVGKMKAQLPKEAFRPKPSTALIDIPCLALIVLGYWLLATQSFPWYVCLIIGILMGKCFSVMSFLAHDAMHGSVVHSRFWQDVIGFIGMGIFCFTPQLWRYWHNAVHHAHTNEPDQDPDSYGTLDRFKKVPLVKFQVRTGIGSGHWSSIFFFMYRFTYHGQMVLWLASRKLRGFERMNRRKAVLGTLFLVSFWITLAVLLGPRVSFYGILIPMIVGNMTLMSYIATNHFLRPLTPTNKTMLNSMSVQTMPWLDLIHLNFSHHVEHHIFPAMNFVYTPLVKQYLLKYIPEQYVCPAHWKAIWYLYKTPRIYLDNRTLIDPFTGRTMDIEEVQAEMLGQPLSIVSG